MERLKDTMPANLPSFLKRFGLLVSYYRLLKGISEVEFIDSTHLNLYNIENGFSNLTLESIWKIAEFLEISPQTILTQAWDHSGSLSTSELINRIRNLKEKIKIERKKHNKHSSTALQATSRKQH